MNRTRMILFSLLTLVLLAAVPAGAAPLAGPCVTGQGYSPACDVDQDGDVDVLDIQLTAGRWGASGTYVADGWSLTGNAGTSPGANFLGTSDNQALEVKVNNTRALRIEPITNGAANMIGGYHINTVLPGAIGAVISGGGSNSYENMVTDNYGVVVGGVGNQAGDNAGTTMDRPFPVVVGGSGNTSSGYTSFVGAGSNNSSTAYGSVVVGGASNSASGEQATIGGGSGNTASGQYATIPGGSGNLASGNYSFAAGRRAKAGNPGAFVLADSNDFDFAPGVNNAFTARFTGGARFILGINASGQSTWTCAVYNGGSWGCSSDRNLKENFQPVDGKEILAKLATLPITTWNAIGIDPQVKRMGPMAQDFYATFGLGDDDKVITTGDLDGVALASIQGLYQIVQEKDAQIAALQGQNAALEARLAAVEQALGLSK